MEERENRAVDIALGLVPVVVALLITAVIVIVVGQSPKAVLQVVYEGAFGTPIKIADTLVVWVSVAIVSAGLLITFRAGQWNIGAEGQIVLGAIFTVAMSRLVVNMPAAAAVPAMLLSGMIGGMLWGILVGLLKIYGRVNEIFGGLGLNFVATGLTIYLIAGPWKPPNSSSVSASALLPERIWLPTLEGLRVSVYGLVLAIIILITVFFALRGTIWGLQLKAVGRNIQGASMLGVPTNRILLSAYMACGLCAGLVGALIVTGVRHQLVPNISSGYGFLGILVVLLSGFRASLLAPIAFFFAALGIGSVPLQLRLNLDSSLGGVLQGVIVLVFELVQGVRQRYKTRQQSQSMAPVVIQPATAEGGD